jgi:6-methylsalicylate decarboxylase
VIFFINMIDLLSSLARNEPRVDVHQHVWTEPLIEALAERRTLPFVRHGSGSVVLHAAGERPWPIPLHARPASVSGRRGCLAALRDDGLDASLIALSSPIGIEALVRDEALELIDAHLTGVAMLGTGYRAWGPIALDGAEAGDVDVIGRRGCAGVSIPAAALDGARALGQLAPVLDRAAALRLPVFVHPGPAGSVASREAPNGEPAWWPALTGYVSQMQAAWLTFVALGRRVHPDLVVVFSMLAGGAPLLSERLATRDGPSLDLRDPGIFYDTSSYGPRAISAMAQTVGVGQLLYGSDRPVVEPIRSGWDGALQANAGRLLSELRAAA